MFYAYLHKGMKLNQMLKKRTQNQHSFSWLFRKYKKNATLMSDWHCFSRFKISIEQSVLGAHGFGTFFFHHSQPGLTRAALCALSTVAAQSGMQNYNEQQGGGIIKIVYKFWFAWGSGDVDSYTLRIKLPQLDKHVLDISRPRILPLPWQRMNQMQVQANLKNNRTAFNKTYLSMRSKSLSLVTLLERLYLTTWSYYLRGWEL